MVAGCYIKPGFARVIFIPEWLNRMMRFQIAVVVSVGRCCSTAKISNSFMTSAGIPVPKNRDKEAKIRVYLGEIYAVGPFGIVWGLPKMRIVAEDCCPF